MDCDVPLPSARKGSDSSETGGGAYEARGERGNGSCDRGELPASSAGKAGVNIDHYDDTPIQMTGDNLPEIITSFEQAKLTHVFKNVVKAGYIKPTPVQKCAIPAIMAGRDLMACAQSGSGETAAFLIPIINCLLQDFKGLPGAVGQVVEPQVIILVPTRELAMQIGSEARKFANGTMLKTCVAYGGSAYKHQARIIGKGCHILAATPGRLQDFVAKNFISFGCIRFLVLDEADRMLDMGFLPSIVEIMKHYTMVPVGIRKTLMFSATFPEYMQKLAGQFLKNYIFVGTGGVGVGGASSDIEQIFHKMAKCEKPNVLLELVTYNESKRILIFVETKRSADFIAALLCHKMALTSSIHGDRQQRDREEALDNFKSGRHKILVATDIAARGIDIDNVDIVVNYDMPKSIDEYIHRIGRTGRVGSRGKSVSFYDGEKDHALSAELCQVLRQVNQPVPDFLLGSGILEYITRPVVFRRKLERNEVGA